jgi:hypothetical protein
MDEPSASQFRTNSVLTTIVHAIWLIHDPLLEYERQWRNRIYCVNDSMGRQGAANEGAERIVGVVFDENSPRSPLRSGSKGRSTSNLRGMPSDLLPVMQAAIEMMPSVHGSRLTTVAFWESNGTLVGADPWEQLLEHGVRVFKYEILSEPDVLSTLKAGYQLSTAQVDLALRIYDRKREVDSANVQLDPDTWGEMMRFDGGGIGACRRLLSSIGIHAPPGAPA